MWEKTQHFKTTQYTHPTLKNVITDDYRGIKFEHTNFNTIEAAKDFALKYGKLKRPDKPNVPRRMVFTEEFAKGARTINMGELHAGITDFAEHHGIPRADVYLELDYDYDDNEEREPMLTLNVGESEKDFQKRIEEFNAAMVVYEQQMEEIDELDRQRMQAWMDLNKGNKIAELEREILEKIEQLKRLQQANKG